MNKIPKVIHYCWFGRGKKPKLVKRCIKSWNKFLPDYEIIEWNEDNFDIDSNLYVKQAYKAKKYAFVSDYVRLYILYNYGGIYMDTDVEVLQPLDRFLQCEAFIGFESKEFCGTGIIGSKKHNIMIKEFLELYKELKFINEDGSLNQTTNVSLMTNIFMKYGIKLNNMYQIINNMEIFPKTYFCPLNYGNIQTDFSKDTYTIHHFAGSWLPKEVQKNIKNKKLYEKRKKFLCQYMSEEKQI